MLRGSNLLYLGQRFKGQGQRWYSSCLWYFVDTDVQTSFIANSISNFTRKLFMMSGGTILNLGQTSMVKGQGQYEHFACKTL